MRNRQNGTVLEHPTNNLLDLAIRVLVDRRRGLVQQENFWFLQDAAGNTHQLPLTSTEVAPILHDFIVQSTPLSSGSAPFCFSWTRFGYIFLLLVLELSKYVIFELRVFQGLPDFSVRVLVERIEVVAHGT